MSYFEPEFYDDDGRFGQCVDEITPLFEKIQAIAMRYRFESHDAPQDCAIGFLESAEELSGKDWADAVQDY